MGVAIVDSRIGDSAFGKQLGDTSLKLLEYLPVDNPFAIKVQKAKSGSEIVFVSVSLRATECAGHWRAPD